MRTVFLHALILAGAAVAPAAELTGRIVSDQKGVVGATVAAVPYETRYAAALRETRGGPAPTPLASVTTTADGRFKLSVPVTAPPFVVLATFGGLAARTVDGVFEKSDAEDLGEIALGNGESLTGRVVDQEGKPVASALVRIGRDGVPKSTGKDGLFRFDDLQGRGPLGQQVAGTLNVHASGFEVQTAPIRYSGAPATIKLKPSAKKFAGVLKDWSGKPAADAVVRIDGDATTRWVRTDVSGRFEIPGPSGKPGRLQALGRDGSWLEIAAPLGAATPPTFTLTRAATIEGRITRADNGKLVSGAKVTARISGTTQTVRTGVDGRYRLAGLPQGAYRLTFDERTFVLLDRRQVELAPGEVKMLDVALTPAVTLVGRVSDEKGQPVSGARGSIAAGAESRMGMILRTMARDGENQPAFISGLDGTFRATRLPPGTNQRLTVQHHEFERRVVPGLDLVAGLPKPLSLDIVLSPGFILVGSVKDKEGKPIEGARIALNRAVTMTGGRGGNVMSFSSVESVRPLSETDFEGKFEFKGLSAGDYDVAVTKAGFTRHTMTAVKAGDGGSPLDIVLSPGATLSGRVVQPNGQTVTGYTINARPASPGQTSSSSMLGGRNGVTAPVDADGGFLLDGLVPGSAYDISIFGPGEFRGDPKKKGVVAPAADVDIEVAGRGRIAGRVLDAATGAPVTDFEAAYTPARGGGMVVVFRGPGDNERRTPFSSPDGTFAFEEVPPGNFDVTVWARTYQQARTGGITVIAGETKTVEVKAARGLAIRGRVVDAKTGRGIQDATVSARDGGAQGAGMFIMDASGASGALTDADGRFEITDQGPGSYQVSARHTSFSEGSARVVLEDKDGVVDVPLHSGGTIAGVVLSPSGAPLSGAEVALQGGGDSGGVRFGMEGQGTLTDAVGRFRFEHLTAGRYKVGATLRNEASPLVEVPLGAGDVREDIRLSLDGGATVRGVVKGLPENERGGISVGAQGADYFANSRTNADGSFEFAGVPKGTLMLRATAGEMILGSSRTATREVVIAEGQLEVMAEIVFEDGLSISGTVTRAGVPVSGARINAFGMATGRQASGRADENGAFRLSGLEAGRTTVMAFSENFGAQARQTVELSADTSIDLVIPTAKLSGMVVDEVSGLPLEAAVELQLATPPPPGTPNPRLQASTDTSGRFGFEDLEPADFRLTARRSGYESLTRTVKPTEAGEDLRLPLKRGSGLALEARDAQMGFGLRSLFVRVQEGSVDAFFGAVSLDGDGKGEIPGIPPGSYVVTATSPGYAPVRITNVMAPTTALRLLFTPGGAVEFQTTEEFLAQGPRSGQLVSLTGAPVGMGQGGPDSFRLSRLTQRVENLAPGRYRLTLAGGINKSFDVVEGGVAVVTIP